MKPSKLVLLLGAVIVAFTAACDPEIISMNPKSGPEGTLVEVEYDKGGITGTIKFEGTEIQTCNANSLGIGNVLRFTVPYDSQIGNKDVRVYTAGKTSDPVVFQVTGTGSPPQPEIEGYAIGSSTGNDLTLFGKGFTTASQVLIAGSEVAEYISHSYPMREIPLEFVDNVIVCRSATVLQPNTLYDVQVINPENQNSNIFTITLPLRVCIMEFDAIQGVPFPDYYVEQNGTVNTIRRSYTEGGWIIEFQEGETDIPDPKPNCAWSYADMYSFYQAHANAPSSGHYMHGSFIKKGQAGSAIMYMNANLPGMSGLVDSVDVRRAFAVYFEGYTASEKYFRATLHESGHGFNLEHCDAEANVTLMTKSLYLSSNWHCFFSNQSSDIYDDHDIDSVAPGGIPFKARECNPDHETCPQEERE